jgi:hypothetical protein
MRARNYWPSELRRAVSTHGFAVLETSPVFPVLDVYPWLPRRAIAVYRRAVPRLEALPIVRRFGVSTLVLSRKPDDDRRPLGVA